MRTKKAIFNTTTSLLYQVISIISGLIVPKLILEAYGSECNGVISSAVQFMGVISLLTIGLTGATRVELYQSLANNDYLKTSRIMTTTNKYMHKVAYALVVYTIVLAVGYPYIAHTELPVKMVAALIVVVGIGKFFEYFLGIPYRILLHADQKNYIENGTLIIGCIIYTVLSVLMIESKASLFSVKLMTAFITFIGMLVIYIYAKNCYNLKFDKNLPEIELPQRRHAAAHSIANLIHQNSDLVILTIIADIKLVSVYTVYYFVIGQLKRVMTSFTNGLEAAFGNMWAKGEMDLMRKRFSLYEFGIYGLVSVIFSTAWSLIIPFVALYTENVTDIEYIRPTLAALIIVTELVYCIREPYSTIIQATGKYKETKGIAIFEAGINLTISLILALKWNIYGVIIGTLVANIIRTVYYMCYSAKTILSINIEQVIKRLVWFVLTFLVSIFVQGRVLVWLDTDNWIGWGLAGVIMVLISFLITIIAAYLFQKKSFYEIIKTLRR